MFEQKFERKIGDFRELCFSEFITGKLRGVFANTQGELSEEFKLQ